MAATTTIRHRQTKRQNHPKIHKPTSAAIDHAVRLIHAVCGLAGSATWIDDIRADLRADKVQAAIRHLDTAVVFDWLMAALSYQGIADAVAYDYMERHGRAAWRDIEQKLGRGVSCPKLKSYWHFHGCRYEKASRTCAEPEHIGACPCRAMTCGMATSIRPPIRCSCSSATLPTAIWSAGSTSSCRPPTVRLARTGCLEWRRP